MPKKDKLNKHQMELVKQCRYYNGESECNWLIPDDDLTTFWNVEREWVNGMFDKNLGELPYLYKCGVKKRQGIPETLLAYFAHLYFDSPIDTNELAKSFNKFIDRYLFIANDHYPEDEIPNHE